MRRAEYRGQGDNNYSHRQEAMEPTTKTPPARRAALADVHRMKNIIGLDKDGWVDFLSSAFGRESAKDLTDRELAELRQRLHDITDPHQTQTGRSVRPEKDAEIVKWRRLVYGVIGSWLRQGRYRSDADAIRTVACRATRHDNFNQITLSELKQLYHSWRRKERVATKSEELKQLLSSTSLN